MTPMETLKAYIGWLGCLVFIIAAIALNTATKPARPDQTPEERRAKEDAAYEQRLADKKAACVGPDALWDDGELHGTGMGWKNHCWRGEALRKRLQELARPLDCYDFVGGLNSMLPSGQRMGVRETGQFCDTQKR
jgi:hypothetical protein